MLITHEIVSLCALTCVYLLVYSVFIFFLALLFQTGLYRQATRLHQRGRKLFLSRLGEGSVQLRGVPQGVAGGSSGRH